MLTFLISCRAKIANVVEQLREKEAGRYRSGI
jgi:hypothetical protein